MQELFPFQINYTISDSDRKYIEEQKNKQMKKENNTAKKIHIKE